MRHNLTPPGQGRPLHYAYRQRATHYTRRQDTDQTMRNMLDFIVEHRREKHISPSYREISQKFGIAISTTHYYIELLELAGFLQPRQPGLSRSLVPTSEVENG